MNMPRSISHGPVDQVKVLELLETANVALLTKPPNLPRCIAALRVALQYSGIDSEVNAALQFVWGNYLENVGNFRLAITKFQLAKELNPLIWVIDANTAIRRCAEKQQQFKEQQPEEQRDEEQRDEEQQDEEQQDEGQQAEEQQTGKQLARGQ